MDLTRLDKSFISQGKRKLMGDIDELKDKAKLLRALLEQYSSTDPEVKDAYGWIKPLLDEAESGRAVLPTKFPYGWIFFSGENNLPSYPDLCGAVAEFANILEQS